MANWPTSVSTNDQLYIAANDKSTALTVAMTNSDTTATVGSTTGFPTAGLISIDNEIIAYTGVTATSFTGLTRGQDGTSAASHLLGASVDHNVVAAHHNVLKDEIIAIEASLNLTASKAVQTNASGRVEASTVTSTELGYVSGVTSAIQTQLNGKEPTITTLPISKGGTNSGAALNNNRIMQSSGGAIVEAAAIAAAKMLISSASGIPIAANTNADMGANKITGLADGTATTDAAAFGQIHLRQIPLFASETTGGSTTSTSFVTSGASVSITPSSTSSKILIMGMGLLNNATSTNGSQAVLGIARGGTELFSRAASPAKLVVGGTDSAFASTLTVFYLDSPSTTSSTTYQLMIASGTGTTVNFGGAVATGTATYILVAEVF